MTTKDDGRDDACSLYSCCLTDQQWQVIEPLLPVPRRGRPRIHHLRLVLDTILYVLRTGCAWRLVEVPPIWPRGTPPTAVFAPGRLKGCTTTSTKRCATRSGRARAVIRLHRRRCWTRRLCTRPKAAKTRLGSGEKTRGRKRHLLVDTLGLLMVCCVHSAAVCDRTRARLVLGWLDQQHPTIGLVWADGGYANSVDDSLIGWAEHKIGVKLQVVKRSDDVKGFQVLPRRWVVERSFSWLGRCRRLSRDFELPRRRGNSNYSEVRVIPRWV